MVSSSVSGGELREYRHPDMERISSKPLVIPVRLPSRTATEPQRHKSLELSVLADASLDSALRALYTSDEYRDDVFTFFEQVTGNEEVAAEILYQTHRQGLSPFIAFSIAWNESRFRTTALNYNSASVDRGVFQLNDRSFPHLKEHDFYNLKTNVEYGVEYFLWCLKYSDQDERTALAMYNAGIGRVRAGTVPQMTFDYIDRYYGFKTELLDSFRQFLVQLSSSI